MKMVQVVTAQLHFYFLFLKIVLCDVDIDSLYNMT